MHPLLLQLQALRPGLPEGLSSCRGAFDRQASPPAPDLTEDDWFDEDLQPVRESKKSAERQQASMPEGFELPKATNVICSPPTV